MTLQDLMMLYGVTLGKRRTEKQKYLFAQQLNESLPPLGWPVRVQQREGRFSKIENLIAERQAARKAKDFARADEIRDLLTEKGIILEDTREGVRWKRA